MGDLELLTKAVCDPSREVVVVEDASPVPATAVACDLAGTSAPLDELLVEPARMDRVSAVVLHEAHLTTAPRWGGSWMDLCWLGGVLPGFYLDNGAHSRERLLEAMANLGSVVAMTDARAVLTAPDRGAGWLADVQRFGMIAALDLRPSGVTVPQLGTAAEAWADAGVLLDCCVTVGPASGPVHPSSLGGLLAVAQPASPG
jgi:hypothetical protein